MRAGLARRSALLALALAWTSACAGDGTGLDEFGNRLGGGPTGPLDSTLSSIQAHILTPICTQCHEGASAPLGLSLEAGLSYGNLVNVPSEGVPELVRVKPLDPDSSYLVHKLEGRSGIAGARMPFGLPPLSQDEIAAVRGWIAAGAADN